jgi:hypothetical protein
MPLQIRRGTEAERQTLTSTNGLVTGELLYVTNTQKLYIGTGVTGDHKGVAITGYTNEDAQDAVGPMFQNGTHTGIQFVYDDLNSYVNATVNLSNYQGVIKADGFVGSLFADDSTTMVNGVAGVFNLDETVGTHVVPKTSNTFDLGSSTYGFRNLYLGDALITSTGSAVNLPIGSTIGGDFIGVVPGSNYNINIVGDDSSVMINSSSKTIIGNIYAGNSTSPVLLNGTDGTDAVYRGSIRSSLETVLVDYTSEVLRGTNIFSSNSFVGTSETPSTTMLSLTVATDSTSPNLVTVRKSRGTLNTPTAIQAGDLINSYLGLGHDGSGFYTATSISSRATGTILTGIVPGQLEFATASTSGVLTTRVTIDNTGSLLTGSIRQTVNSYSSTSSIFSVNQYHNTPDSSNYSFLRGRGSSTVPGPIELGDDIIDIVFSGINSAGTPTAAAAISVVVSDTVTTEVPANISIQINSGAGPAERFVLDNTGVIDHKQTVLVTGVGSGQVDTSSVAGYYRSKINGIEVAVPYYNINP